MRVGLQAVYVHYSKFIFLARLSFGGNSADVKAKNFAKKPLATTLTAPIIAIVRNAELDIRNTQNAIRIRGCSSVVERHVANVNVVSSNLITRFVEIL